MSVRELPALRTRKVAVVGVGAMGRRHVRVLRGLPDLFEVAGVFDVDPRAADDVGREHGVAVLASERECIASAELVVIASPIGAHAASAGRALAAGRHVLVEKPLCASVGEAEALVAQEARGAAKLLVGHSERFNPVSLALKRLVRPAEITDIRIRRTTPASPSRREHGVLLSLGVHDVDLVAYLTCARLTVGSVDAVPPMGDEDKAEVFLTTSTGAAARLFQSRVAERRERAIEVVTRDAVYEGDLLAPRLVRRGRKDRSVTEIELVMLEPLAEQARAVAAALAGRGSARVATGVDGATALSLVQPTYLRAG